MLGLLVQSDDPNSESSWFLNDKRILISPRRLRACHRALALLAENIFQKARKLIF